MWSLEQLFDWLSPTYARQRREYAAKMEGYNKPGLSDSGGSLEERFKLQQFPMYLQYQKDKPWTQEEYDWYMKNKSPNVNLPYKGLL